MHLNRYLTSIAPNPAKPVMASTNTGSQDVFLRQEVSLEHGLFNDQAADDPYAICLTSFPPEAVNLTDPDDNLDYNGEYLYQYSGSRYTKGRDILSLGTIHK